MQAETDQSNQHIRHEPDERLSPGLSLGLGFQYAALALGGIVLTPAIIVRAAGESDAYLSWAVWSPGASASTISIAYWMRPG